MSVKICISVLVCFGILNSALACNEITIKQLYDLERRARNYKADGPNEGFISDFIISDEWYSVTKFNEQYIMPDSSKIPDYFSCGTNEVIYLEGEHPDVAALTAIPVDANACLRDTFEDCAIRYPIQIRKCGAEIQYFLVPTKQYSAYCFDPPAVQDITDFLPPPSDVHLGAVTVKPKLVHDKDNIQLIIDGVLQDTINFWPRLEFHCSFETQKNYLYSVSWYMNGNFFLAFGPTDNVDELIVTEQMLLDHNIGLGFTMKCGVRVSQDKAGQSTPVESSPDYFAGIKAKIVLCSV